MCQNEADWEVAWRAQVPLKVWFFQHRFLSSETGTNLTQRTWRFAAVKSVKRLGCCIYIYIFLSTWLFWSIFVPLYSPDRFSCVSRRFLEEALTLLLPAEVIAWRNACCFPQTFVSCLLHPPWDRRVLFQHSSSSSCFKCEGCASFFRPVLAVRGHHLQWWPVWLDVGGVGFGKGSLSCWELPVFPNFCHC